MMRAGIISKYSDVLRLALQIMPVPTTIEDGSLENSDQDQHSRHDDATLPFQAVCRNNDAVQSELRHLCQTGW